jgi:hypothetical protein
MGAHHRVVNWLPSARFAALLRALAALLWTTALFHLRGNRAVARATYRAIGVQPASDAAIAARQTDLWRSYAAFRRLRRVWPGGAACLQSALALQKMLEWQGIAAVVRVGAQQEPETLTAHAWVEVGSYRIGALPGYDGFVALAAPRNLPDRTPA